MATKQGAAKKATATAAPVEVRSAFSPGDTVVFNGYDDSVPEAERVLVEGQSYVVVDVKDEEGVLGLEAPNPDFNPKARESDRNRPTIIVEAYDDEVSMAEDSDDDETTDIDETTAGGDDEEEVVEEDVIEEAPAAPAKTSKTRAATKTVTTAKPATPAKTTKAASTTKAATTKAAPAAKAPATTKPAPAAKGKAAVSKAVSKAVAKPEPADEFGALEHEDEEVLAMVTGAENLLDLAKEVANESVVAEWTLAGVLFHVRLTGEYKNLKPEYADDKGFATYVQNELGIQYRKAMYLVSIYHRFNQYGLGADYLQAVGWSKCALIARVMKEDNVEALSTLAETSTVVDLKEAIKEGYTSTSPTDGRSTKEKAVRFSFKLYAAAATAVQEIFQRHAQRLGTKNMDQVFEQIVTEWAVEHDDGAKTKRTTTTRATTAPKARGASARPAAASA